MNKFKAGDVITKSGYGGTFYVVDVGFYSYKLKPVLGLGSRFATKIFVDREYTKIGVVKELKPKEKFYLDI